jgi:hypothetical protein
VDGVATRDQAREFLDAVLAHPHFERGFAFLGDRRNVASGLDAAYIGAVVDEIRHRAHVLAPCRWAVVVATEDGFGAIRMCAMLSDRTGVQIAPFTSADRAAEWAGRTSTK